MADEEIKKGSGRCIDCGTEVPGKDWRCDKDKELHGSRASKGPGYSRQARRTAAARKTLPSEIVLDDLQIAKLVTGLRLLAVARDKLRSAQKHAGDEPGDDVRQEAVELALLDLAESYDEAVPLLREALPAEFIPLDFPAG